MIQYLIVAEINRNGYLNNFCLKTFIKERENHSSAFTFEKFQKQLEKLAESFPNLNSVAN